MSPETTAAVSDDIMGCLKNGTVKPVPGISKFTENGVVLSDGKYYAVDQVIMGTGYGPILTHSQI